jgi:diguanylate cyclase (GGDEF)-like protein
MQSALAVPLEGVHGVVGVLAVYARAKNAFTDDHLRILSVVTTKVAVSIENALKYRQAEDSATTDALTALPNARSLFLRLETELTHASRKNLPLALLVCDLDGFKQINDRFGHLEGNRVLQAVGRALKHQCREEDFVARMGGDEFVIVLSNYRNESVAAKVDQFCRAVAEAGRGSIGGSTLGMSVGVAFYPNDGDTVESLLREADRRMYTIKHQGENPAVVVGM